MTQFIRAAEASFEKLQLSFLVSDDPKVFDQPCQVYCGETLEGIAPFACPAVDHYISRDEALIPSALRHELAQV